MLLSGEGAERPIYLQFIFVQINELEQLLIRLCLRKITGFIREYDGRDTEA